MHDINSTSVKINIALVALINTLYPTYFHYLESIQVSGQLKAFTLDTLVNKFVEHETIFDKNIVEPIGDTLCVAQKGKNSSYDFFSGEGSKPGQSRNNNN